MFFYHGGDILGAQKKFGLEFEQIIDFSSNINSIGFPQAVKEIIIQSIDSILMYPDNSCMELKGLISEYLNLLPQNVVPTNGAMEIIQLFFEIYNIKSVAILSPTFLEYERIASLKGIECQYIELKEEMAFEIDEAAIIKNLNKVEAVIICNPNNPTSKLYKRSRIEKIIEECSNRNIQVLVDETFIELTLDGNTNSVVNLVENFTNLVVMRAFTKYFAIPGLRLGYAVSNREYCNAMLDRKTTWSVNVFASKMGKILTDEKSFRALTLKWMSSEIPYMTEKLSEFGFLKVFKPDTIFILCKIMSDELNSEKFYDMLGNKGVLIRDASNFRCLDKKYIRIAVKDRLSNDILLEKINEIVFG